MSTQDNLIVPLSEPERTEIDRILHAFALIPSKNDREKAAIFLEGMAAASRVNPPKATA